jgi:CubicO group peptidase (beta-lactamase class C family)
MYDRVDAYPRLHPTVSNSVPFRRAEVGAVNGHGNARAIATINAVLVNDEVNGLRLLSKAGRERVLEPQSEGGVDLLLGIPMVWGMGYALHSPLVTNPPESHIAYWGGQGGHLSFVDFDVRMSIGYTINRWMFGRYELVRMNRIIDATYACLAKMGTVNRIGKLRLTGN